MNIKPYIKKECACGKLVGENVFKQHARKCSTQLREWAKEGRSMHMLDERSEEQKAADPILNEWTAQV